MGWLAVLSAGEIEDVPSRRAPGCSEDGIGDLGERTESWSQRAS